MGKPILIMTLLGLMALVGRPGWGSYLETDPETGGGGRVVPPRPGGVGNEITRLVRRVEVGRPFTTRNMMVFPLYVEGGTDPTRYVMLDDAIAQGLLRVYEKDQGRVQEVIVRNTSRSTIFLMAGEIISGAKQNRVIATDVLLRADGPEVAVPVYCVERGRWAGDTMHFRTDKSFANAALRDMAQSKAGQDAVWDEVKRVSEEAGVESKTGSFQDVVNDAGVRDALDEYGKIMPEPPRRCMGVAIAINNQVVGVELFANEALFTALWPKIRRGYALDAHPLFPEYERTRWLRLIDERDVRAFLDRVYDARFARRDGIDLGFMYTIRTDGLSGEGLIHDAGVIHVNFTQTRPRPVPIPRDPIIIHGDNTPPDGDDRQMEGE
ncbi:MAG: hypothetical protein JW889_04355 [Verrucomicrobia bacterium]|nr:hypothetical protein [Verrucomicrobiota bacterium]